MSTFTNLSKDTTLLQFCTFMHLADAIMQSEFLPANVSSGNQTHDLVALQIAKFCQNC